MLIKTLGVDLGKLSCHVIGHDQHGKVVEKRKILISKFAEYLANLPPCGVFFEACGGAHHWSRKARSVGHRAEMIPVNFVKPFVKSNKNDFDDAFAICEAAQRPAMRFAHVRSDNNKLSRPDPHPASNIWPAFGTRGKNLSYKPDISTLTVLSKNSLAFWS